MLAILFVAINVYCNSTIDELDKEMKQYLEEAYKQIKPLNYTY